MRTVVLLCGPAGAGKTTAARESGLEVFDRDDAHWESERHFRAALRNLAADSTARAVVIRAGATSAARAQAAAMIRATHTFMVVQDRQECARRIQRRGRSDVVGTLSSLKKWFSTHDRDDGVRDFPGWGALDVGVLDLGSPSRDW